MRDIGKNIRQLRTQKNMTQDEMAEKLFVTRQTVSNYETGRSRPDVEMLTKIAEVLETDANTVIYGPAPTVDKAPLYCLMAGCGIVIALILLRKAIEPSINAFRASNFLVGGSMIIYGLLDPLFWLVSGWTLVQMLTMAVKKPPLHGRWVPYIRRVMAVVLILWLVISLAYILPWALDDYLYWAKLRGYWVEEPYGKSWQRIPLPMVEWMEPVGHPVLKISVYYPWSLGCLGIGLCLCGFPPIRNKPRKSTRPDT